MTKIRIHLSFAILFVYFSSCTLTRTIPEVERYKTDQIEVYYDQKDINKNYEIIGFVQFDRAEISIPFTGISYFGFTIQRPTLDQGKKCIIKLQKAANKIGGDAIIMTTAYCAKVIKFKSQPSAYPPPSKYPYSKPNQNSNPNTQQIQTGNTIIEKPDTSFSKGIENFNSENYKRSLDNFNKVIENNPQNADAYFYRGQVKQKLNDLDGACLDWAELRKLGNKLANDLLMKYCQ